MVPEVESFFSAVTCCSLPVSISVWLCSERKVKSALTENSPLYSGVKTGNFANVTGHSGHTFLFSDSWTIGNEVVQHSALQSGQKPVCPQAEIHHGRENKGKNNTRRTSWTPSPYLEREGTSLIMLCNCSTYTGLDMELTLHLYCYPNIITDHNSKKFLSLHVR